MDIRYGTIKRPGTAALQTLSLVTTDTHIPYLELKNHILWYISSFKRGNRQFSSSLW